MRAIASAGDRRRRRTPQSSPLRSPQVTPEPMIAFLEGARRPSARKSRMASRRFLSASLRRHAEPRSSDRAHQGSAVVIEPKAINDAFGHAAGDSALRAFAEVLRSTPAPRTPSCAPAARSSPACSPHTTHDEAGRIANPVMAAVRAAHIGAQRQPDRLCLGGVLAPVA